jgi:sortase (surface protein transpeptidase)
VQVVSLMTGIVILAFVLQLTVISAVQHAVAQQQLGDTFRKQLADGTAPVSEGTFDDKLLADGAPVAILEIPSIGLYEVVVEGTTPGDLMGGPGHRRDTVLPGQQGASVVYGRAAAYGGPFARLQQVPAGAKIFVTTGQGRQVFVATGIRYAGDPTPPPPTKGQARLLLASARGLPFLPTGAVYLDAQLTTPALETGARQTTFGLLPPAAKLFGTDTTTVWSLVFALQFVIAAELALLWSRRRVDSRQIWVVFTPILLLGGLWASVQLALLLPNIL